MPTQANRTFMTNETFRLSFRLRKILLQICLSKHMNIKTQTTQSQTQTSVLYLHEPQAITAKTFKSTENPWNITNFVLKVRCRLWFMRNQDFTFQHAHPGKPWYQQFQTLKIIVKYKECWNSTLNTRISKAEEYSSRTLNIGLLERVG